MELEDNMDKTFQAVLQKSPSKGGWTFVVMEDSAEYFGTKGGLLLQSWVMKWSTTAAEGRCLLG